MKVGIRKRLFVGALALVLLIGPGCLTQNIVVVVEPGGSGNIAITRVMSSRLLAGIAMQMQQMQETFGESAEVNLPFDPEHPLYNREALERAAALYGDGVTFVNARPVDRAGAKGVQVMYAFEDINDVRVNPNVLLALMTLFSGENDDLNLMGEVPAMEEIQFSFSAEGDMNQLRVLLPGGMKGVEQKREEMRAQAAESEPVDEFADLPPYMEADRGMAGAALFGFTGKESPERVMRMLFAGTRMSLAVEVRGDIMETTAQYPHIRRPSRFTVYDIDFDSVMAHPDFGRLLGGMDGLENSESPDAFMDALYALPTVTVDDQAEISIFFQ